LALSPNSLATTAADLPLVSQLLTASRLNVSSNLRRVVTGDCFKVLIIQAFTQSSVHQFAPTSEHPAPSSVQYIAIPEKRSFPGNEKHRFFGIADFGGGPEGLIASQIAYSVRLINRLKIT
jgi:hypothetical protein